MNDFFHITERGSSVKQEVLGGITTFLAMAYIVIANPTILSEAGVPLQGAICGTCLSAALMSLLMGLITNRPIAMASGMGVNTMIVYTICLSYSVDWRLGMCLIFLEGLLVCALTLAGVRAAILNAIPKDLQRAISAGIGLFIIWVACTNISLIVPGESVPYTFGTPSSASLIVALVSLVVALIVSKIKNPFAFIASLAAGALVGIPLGVTPLLPQEMIGVDFSTLAAPFQQTPDGSVALIEFFKTPVLLLVIPAFIMEDFFSSMGTVLAVGQAGDFVNEQGEVEDAQSILLVDSMGASVGGFFGVSSLTSYTESVSGILSGARSGLSSMICAALFLVCLIFSPLFTIIGSEALFGTLVMVGLMIMKEGRDIHWRDPLCAIYSVLTMLFMLIGNSIATGIGVGFISYCVLMILTGKAKHITKIMWVSTAIFVLIFISMALS